MISILGCGWTGVALKDVLTTQYNVSCLSRDIDKNIKEGLYNCECLVIAIPPRDNYLEILHKTLSLLQVSTQVILLSSISFYNKKYLVIEAESLVQKLHKRTVILRLGGLMGYNRIAGKYTAGKTLSFDSKTNYVHRDDVIAIIQSVINNNVENEIFDIVAPEQSTKKEIFSQNAKKFGFEETIFLSHFKEVKELSSNKVCKILNYSFVKSDVRSFWE